MGVLGDLIGNLRAGYRAGAADVNDERFWSTAGLIGVSSSGIAVTRAQALRVSCIFQGLRLVAETVGSLPLIVYEEEVSGDGDQVYKRRARKHYLWRLLRRQPNDWQTAQEFRETMTAWAKLHGKAYAKINSDGTAAVTELLPIDPELVTEEHLENGRIRYDVVGLGRKLVQEEMFTIRDFGLQRFIGEPLLSLARETIGLWIAHEKFRSTYFSHGATQGLWLKTPRKLSPEVYNRLKETAAQRYAGPQNWHKVQIAEEGLEPVPVGFDPKASQMTESLESVVADVARWLNIPLHMMKVLGQTTTFASAEQFAGEFVDYALRPTCVRWEQSVDRDMIFEDNVYVEHLMDALLRGNTLERAQADQIYVNSGVKTRNEVRRQENLNPLPGLDEPLTPLNMERTGAAATPAKTSAPARRPQKGKSDEDEEEAAAPRRLQLIVRNVARSVAHQETNQIVAYAAKLAGKPAAAWSDWLHSFYEGFVATVATRLELEPSIARSYTERRREQLQILGVGTCPPNWEEVGAELLFDLAIESTKTEEPVHV